MHRLSCDRHFVFFSFDCLSTIVTFLLRCILTSTLIAKSTEKSTHCLGEKNVFVGKLRKKLIWKKKLTFRKITHRLLDFLLLCWMLCVWIEIDLARKKSHPPKKTINSQVHGSYTQWLNANAKFFHFHGINTWALVWFEKFLFVWTLPACKFRWKEENVFAPQ